MHAVDRPCKLNKTTYESRFTGEVFPQKTMNIGMRKEVTGYTLYPTWVAFLLSRADIQRRGAKLAWMTILSVYGADTIAIDLSLSALIS